MGGEGFDLELLLKQIQEGIRSLEGELDLSELAKALLTQDLSQLEQMIRDAADQAGIQRIENMLQLGFFTRRTMEQLNSEGAGRELRDLAQQLRESGMPDVQVEALLERARWFEEHGDLAEAARYFEAAANEASDVDELAEKALALAERARSQAERAESLERELAAGDEAYGAGRYLSTFIGLAPVADCRIVVLVSVKAPSKNGYYGSVVAAPVVKNITLRTLRHMNVPQAEPVSIALGERP